MNAHRRIADVRDVGLILIALAVAWGSAIGWWITDRPWLMFALSLCVIVALCVILGIAYQGCRHEV